MKGRPLEGFDRSHHRQKKVALVTQVLVRDPCKNALLKVANKSHRIDSRKLAELLRSKLLRSVYHEDTGIRTVKN